jgi:hypothetical protein
VVEGRCIEEGCYVTLETCFLLQIDEFMVHNFLRPLDDMELYGGDVFVIWKWAYVVCDESSIEHEDESSIEENSNPEDSDEEMVT